MPGFLRQYIEAVAQHNGFDKRDFQQEVIERIEADGSVKGFLIHPNKLYIRLAGAQSYECGKCRRIHLHPSGGVCSDCLGMLGEAQPSGAAATAEDYYLYLAREAGEIFRLNCEELTGQTNKAIARKRQRLFQEICLPRPKEEKLVDSVDLLSVTTTMEVGVDIGSLLAVNDGEHAPYAI